MQRTGRGAAAPAIEVECERCLLREAEDALGDDVALDLTGAGGDRVLARGQDPIEPARRVRYRRRRLVREGVHAQQLTGGLRDPQAELRAPQLEARAPRARPVAPRLAGSATQAR